MTAASPAAVNQASTAAPQSGRTEIRRPAMLEVRPVTVPTAAPARRARAPSGGVFQVASDAPEIADAALAGAPAECGGAALAGLLAAQEVALAGMPPGDGDPPVRDRAARRRAQELLDRLAALQRRLLHGPLDPAELEALAARCDEHCEVADPVLRGILAAIRLRARVELARFGVA
jgi:hypothetical protein